MKLYHWTKKENLKNIFREGLRINKMGVVYLTPKPEKWRGEVCLEVETGKNKLTAFEDCKDWEILCWGKIGHNNIKLKNLISAQSPVKKKIWHQEITNHFINFILKFSDSFLEKKYLVVEENFLYSADRRKSGRIFIGDFR